MTTKLSVTDLAVKGHNVLMRVDFNVPLDKSARITDDTRIVATIPSIKSVIDRGGSLILMSHLGRPKGKKDAALSLAPCAKRLSELLHQEVLMAPDCIGPETEAMARQLKPGQVLLLENLRFYAAEEHPESDPSFAKKLALLADFYVDDAFGTAHRVHSSTVTVASYFPGKAAAGLLMEKEIRFLGDALSHPVRPFYALIGGAKISTKIEVLKSLVKVVDGLLIGGGMAFTFAKSQGVAIGNSLCEDEYLDTAREVIKLYKDAEVPLYLTDDVVIADSFSNDAHTKTVTLAEGIPDGYQGMDIGPKTIAYYSSLLKKAGTILWNGPLGVFEFPRFAVGTNAIAKLLPETSAITIVGGGDSLAAVKEAGVADKITHLSTGGGATLEYLQYGTLLGVEALSEKL